MKPILFSTEMVNAILDRQKTQTRRVINPQPDGVAQGKTPFKYKNVDVVRDGKLITITHPEGEPDKPFIKTIKPKYQVGDILWVRETWLETNPSDCTCYECYGDCMPKYVYRADGIDEDYKWRPSIFMPKKAARLFLKVTGVRVERVRDISWEDAIDEGIRPIYTDYETVNGSILGTGLQIDTTKTIKKYEQLWDKLNKKRGYGRGTNPWVFVYEFERTDKP